MTVAVLTLYPTFPARADVLFSYGPSTTYVTGNKTYARVASATGSGPYAFTNAFSDTTALLNPTSGYTGPAFYGGYQFTSSTINAGLSSQYVRDAFSTSSNDYLWLQAQRTGGWTGSELSMHGSYIFKQAQFNSGFTTGSLSISNLTVLVNGFGSADAAGNSYDATGRFMVQIAGTYYVSESTFSVAGNTNATFTLTGLPSARWAIYDPASSLDFDQSAATYTALTLDAVTEVGIYFEDDSWTGTSSSNTAFGLGIGSFLVDGSVVPEPSALSMLLPGLSAMVLLYRRRKM